MNVSNYNNNNNNNVRIVYHTFYALVLLLPTVGTR